MTNNLPQLIVEHFDGSRSYFGPTQLERGWHKEAHFGLILKGINNSRIEIPYSSIKYYWVESRRING